MESTSNIINLPEFEDYIVGCLCQDGKSLNDIYPHVIPEDFKNTNARLAYEAAARLAREERVISAPSIFEEILLSGNEIPDHYLLECQQIVPTVTNASEYARALHERAERDRFAHKLENVSQGLLKGAVSIEDARQRTEQAMNDMFFSDDGIKSSEDAISSAMQELEDRATGKYKPLYSGFNSIDKTLEGFRRGGLYIIGARPASGKTTFALNIANNMTEAHKKVLFVSLEMTTDQIVQCRLQLVGKIPSYELNYTSTKNAPKKIEDAVKWMRDHPIDFCKKNTVTVGYLEKIALHNKYDCIVIDYLQLIRATSGNTQYEKVSGVSNALKRLALKLDIPIICLSQLNRRSGEVGEPELTDLRDSGSIEQDADAVLLLHLYERSIDASPSTLNVRIAKNRYGDMKTISFDWFMRTRIMKEREYK